MQSVQNMNPIRALIRYINRTVMASEVCEHIVSNRLENDPRYDIRVFNPNQCVNTLIKTSSSTDDHLPHLTLIHPEKPKEVIYILDDITLSQKGVTPKALLEQCLGQIVMNHLDPNTNLSIAAPDSTTWEKALLEIPIERRRLLGLKIYLVTAKEIYEDFG